MLTASCSPDANELGSMDVTSAQLAAGQGFTINVDQSTNLVTFQSQMPSSYSVYWEFGPKPAADEAPSVSGTSTNSTYKVGIAFDGEYYVRMGVETRGGLVFGEPEYFTIDNMNPNLISDETWTMLTGGVGHSKTWVLDLDPNDGSALKFGGPKWFYTSGQNWDSFHNAAGENYIDADAWDASTAIDPSVSGEWYWAADWAGNSWICGLADYGEMTFDLINGANVDVNGNKGAFNMDIDAHTITFTGVVPLSCGTEGSITTLCPSGTYKIIYISENALQILFDGGPAPAETPFTMNYISKEYKENYVPPVVTDITLPEGWKDYIEPFNQKTTSYKFSEEEPYLWCALDGTFINRESPFGINENIMEASIELNNAEKTFKIVDIDGNETEGTYKLDDKGKFTFSSFPSFNISQGPEVKFASSTRQLQVINYELDDMSGDIVDLYLGSTQYDAQGNAYEYLVYHFIKETGAPKVESFKASLSIGDEGFNFLTSEQFVTGEGMYTFSVEPDGDISSKVHLCFFDIYKLLKKHPNADIVINSIKVDGKELMGSNEYFADDVISRGVGDDPATGRRYPLNPWNEESAANTAAFSFSNSFVMTVTVKYDTGDVVLK